MSYLNIINGRRHHHQHHIMSSAAPEVISYVVSKLTTTTPHHTINSTISASASNTPYSTSAAAIIVIITSLLTVGCVLGNSLVILAVLQVHKLRTASNYLIVSLAVSDWFVGLFVMPLSIAYEILGFWPLGKAACAIWVTFDVTLCTASILNLMMISIDRYLVITRPFRYAQQRTTKLMVLYIAIAWFVSLVISITPMLVPWSPEYGKNGEICQVSQEIEYQIYATSVAFYLPLAVMFGLYGRIFFISRAIAKAEAMNNPRPINNHTSINHRVDYKNGCVESKMALPHELVPLDDQNQNQNNNHNNDSQIDRESLSFQKQPLGTIREQSSNLELDTVLKDEVLPSNGRQESITSDSLPPITNHKPKHSSIKKFSVATLSSIRNFLGRRKSARNSQAIKTLGVIMGLFTACWLPFFILAVVAPICGTYCNVPKWMWGALTWLGYANSCFNPLIYARFNREFRTPFREILCCRCKTINESVRHTDYLYQYGE